MFAAVRREIEAALPGVAFYCNPSGSRKLADAAVLGVEIPQVIINHFRGSSAHWQANYEGNDCSIRFHLGVIDQDPMTTVGLECRGDGNLSDLLERLIVATGGCLDDHNGTRFEP